MKEKDKAVNTEKTVVKSTKEQPHIIRRQVKIINTDEQVKKEKPNNMNLIDLEPKKEVKHKPRENNSNSSNNRNRFLNNKNANVVIMKNGKKVEKEEIKKVEIKKEEIKPVKKEEVKTEEVKETVKKEEVKETKEVVRKTENNQTSRNENRSYNRNDNNSDNRSYNRPYNRDGNNSENRPYNRDGNNSENRPYNRDGNNSGNRPYNRDGNNSGNRPYNRDGNNSGNRPYNRDGNNSGNRPYNRDGNNSGNRPYNRDGNNSGNRTYNRDGNNSGNRPYNRDGNNSGNRPYNRDGNNSGNRPYNRDGNNSGNRPYNRDGNNSGNRPYNRDGNRPYNRDGNNGGNSSAYQVNKFMKNAATMPIEQKESKDYSQTLINKDKDKFNNESRQQDKKQEKKNKNVIREQNTRIDVGKLKGLEVDTEKGMLDLYDRGVEVRKGNKKQKKQKQETKQTLIIPMTEVKLPEIMTVKSFAEIIKKTSAEVIKKLFGLGIMATLNQEIDFDTAFLIAEEYGITAEKEVVQTEEDILFDDTEDTEDELLPRPPIVCVMGHVDHGKTSILDYIRKSNVQEGEAGGITQHIGAYKVKVKDKEITFLDTPGHEAFTEMRARGAQVTDIAIIVVAADDGIMPQTVEAINHAKAAEVSIMVAINKIDKPGANIDKVKQELLENGLVPEEWGGDTMCVPVSALTGEGMDNLLDMILLVAEVKDLRANPNKQSKGTVIEARLDKSKGAVASLLVQRGTLNVGDTIICGEVIGRIRAMQDDKGRKVKLAGPSTPVEVMGLSSVPETGDTFYEVKDERTAKHLIEKRKATSRKALIKQGAKVTLDDLFSQIKQGEIKDLNIIVKADVQGSVEAVKDSLEKLSNDEVRVRVIHGAAGAISESDVTLAMVSNAIIIGFNVRPNPVAESIAKKEKVDLRLYRVIYDAIQDVETAMTGMLAPTYKEVVHGTAEVRTIFNISNVGTICGCYVKSGKVVRNGLIRVIRDNIVIAEDKIDSLKRMKDDAREVAENYECGIKLEKFNDIKELDILECFELVEEDKTKK